MRQRTLFVYGRSMGQPGYSFILGLILMGIPCCAQQDVAIGTWRAHISYNNIKTIALGDTKVFGAATDAITIVDKTDNSISSYSKLNGLSATGISYINYDVLTQQLLVSYEDGNLDIIKENVVTNFSRLKDLPGVTGSLRINHISFHTRYAYLATDYGVVVFDLLNNEVKETWRDLSTTGNKLKVFQSTFLNDSVFLATENGVLVGSINDNLLDYNKWKRFNNGDFNTTIGGIATFGNSIYTTVDGVGLYRYNTGSWLRETYLQGKTFAAIKASASSLYITEGSTVWRVNDAHAITAITDAMLIQPQDALEDANGVHWIGDAQQGLVSDIGGSFKPLVTNGPANATAFTLAYSSNTMYSLPGGYSSSFQPLSTNRGFDIFYNGIWSNQSSSGKDLTSIAFSATPRKYYVSSFGYGVEARDASGSLKFYNDTNSPLVNLNPPGNFVNIPAVVNSSTGLWVINYGTLNSLHLLKNDDTWESFSFPLISAARYPLDLLVDYNQYVWIILNPSQGGGLIVFDKEKARNVYLTDQSGSGALPDKGVNCITLDRDGYVWVGTNSGVAYFIDPYSIFTSGSDAVKPIFDNRYLLKGERITAMACDGANRKWIGTEKGVWLFNATGEELIYNFTEDNSPLLSNLITDIKINDITGEVFFATARGIISYRADATGSTNVFQDVKIFPNPVTHAFAGTVGISGLARDAIVKITDSSGKLIWQTQANGGTATWNLYDYSGHHASTGVYIVFAATADGSESAVGKIAVVE